MQQIFRKTHMTSLSHIFPSDYLNPPTDADLQYEVQDLLRRTDNPQHLIAHIDSLACPFYKAALMQCLKHMWHTLVEKQDPRTGYEDGNGRWILYWMEAEQVMKHYCRRYQNEQYAYIYATNSPEPPGEAEPIEPEPAAEPQVQEPPKTVTHIANQVKNAIEQVLYGLATAPTPPQLQSLTININIHNYNAPIGQYAHHIDQQNNK